MQVRSSDIVLIISALVFPPLGVFLIAGLNIDFVINVLLTLIGYLPGHIHALWLIYLKLKADEDYGVCRHEYVAYGTFKPLSEKRSPRKALWYREKDQDQKSKS